MKSLSSIVLAWVLSAPAAAQVAPFWVHPFNFFGDESAFTASVSLADLDGDGDVDGFAVNGRHWIQQDEVFFNNGDGFFRSAIDAGPARATGYQAALADFDGDGDLDAGIARDLLPTLLLLNNGSGRFEAAREIGPPTQARGAAAADFDGDGDTDLVVSQRGEVNLVFINDGEGGFSEVVELEGEQQTVGVHAEDVTGDGAPDLVFANRGGEGHVVYVNDGSGGFGAPRFVGADEDIESRSLAVGDVTGDGAPDLVVGGLGTANAVYGNDGAGNFALAQRFGPEDSVTYGIALADFDGDGRLDVVAAHHDRPCVVYLRRDDGFEAVEIDADAANAYAVTVGDLDADGRPDLVFAVSQGSNFTALNRIGDDD